jgi:hypothetical protein
MDSKLTLSLDKDLAKKAKIYARSKGRSLSDLVESYFKVLTSKSARTDDDTINLILQNNYQRNIYND